MKKLKFRETLSKLILSGEKTRTWRLFDDKELKEGDMVSFLVSDTGEEFAKAELTGISQKKLGEIEERDYEGHERYSGKEEMYRTFSGYYNREVNDETYVKIIDFKLFSGIIKDIMDFVEEECKKPTSVYGYEPFVYHFLPMLNYAQRLSDELGGDKEIVQLACLLHDIGAIIHGRKEHHITGAEIAEKKLKELGYPEEKILMIKNCILNHRGSQQRHRKSIEEQIVAEADAMSAFDNLAGLFKAAFLYENKSQEDARRSVREKLERKYNQLHFEKSREMLKDKFEAVSILL